MREDIIEILRENWNHSYNDCADDLEDFFQKKIKEELREKIAEEARNQITMALENCAALGSMAHGDYIERLTNGIVNSIKNKK
tara:strand:+ start:255 stop:503 length:249 start_codon:yes stop_codon:yes gene_type:complete